MAARALMLQGTGSSVGKSLLVAGLARALVRRGLTVRPFKPQNMSNNAAVTAEGGEIGRAQALQALAACVVPSVHMNPVLLKPQSEIGAQVIVQGKVFGRATAREMQELKPKLMPFVLQSFARLKQEADIILVEGAGSASEINLRKNDIANMGFARSGGVPVVVVGDVDRGGVIASLVGTREVLDEDDAKLVAGFIVNRMRGDVSLFADGMAEIARRTGWPALGLVPFFEGARRLPAEDAYDLVERRHERSNGKVRVAVPHLPHIANFDDLDPLAAEPDVEVLMVKQGLPLPVCDLIVLPGSKATIADLASLRAQGWDIDIAAHVRRGGHVLGLCGGYQMLGQTIADPRGIEGAAKVVPGLGLLQVDTVIEGEKTLAEVAGTTLADAAPVKGYEMHMGVSAGPDTARPLVRFADGRADGATSADGRVAGTYVHGFFADDAQRRAWIERLGGTPSRHSHEADVQRTLDELAAHLEAHVDIDRMLRAAR
jgi:adenosylcobyric acid synthase